MRISAPVQTGPGTHPASYTMGTGSIPGGKRPVRGVDHPPAWSADVKKRVELYFYSPVWAFVACSRTNFTLPEHLKFWAPSNTCPSVTSPFKSAGASVQSTTGSRDVGISGSNAGYTVFRVVWRVLATHSILQFPLHFPSRASPFAIRFQLDSTSVCFCVFCFAFVCRQTSA